MKTLITRAMLKHRIPLFHLKETVADERKISFQLLKEAWGCVDLQSADYNQKNGGEVNLLDPSAETLLATFVFRASSVPENSHVAQYKGHYYRLYRQPMSKVNKGSGSMCMIFFQGIKIPDEQLLYISNSPQQ